MRNVAHAVNLARHCAHGWNDPALPDDYAAVADLLHTTPDAVMMRLGVDPYTAPENAVLKGGSADSPA